MMNRVLAATLASAMLLSSTAVFAGGPVIIDDETEVVPAKPSSSVGILPIIIVTFALCAALCGGNNDREVLDNQ